MILLYLDDHDYPHTNVRALSAQNAELQATNLLQQRRFRVLYRRSLALRGRWRGTRVISQMLKCTKYKFEFRIKAMKARRANGLTFLARFAFIFASLQFIFLCHSIILQAWRLRDGDADPPAALHPHPACWDSTPGAYICMCLRHSKTNMEAGHLFSVSALCPHHRHCLLAPLQIQMMQLDGGGRWKLISTK